MLAVYQFCYSRSIEKLCLSWYIFFVDKQLLSFILYMSTTRKLAHNTAAQIGGKAISTILGLVAIAMMTRYLGQEQFGWYITVISFLGFAGIVIDFGLIPVTAQMMSEPRFDKTKLFQNLMGFRFVTALLFFGLIPLVAYFFPYPTEVKIAIAFSTISFLAVSMNQVLVGLYQTKLKMHVQAIAEVLGRIVLVAGLYLVMRYGAGFLPIMWILVLASVSYTIALWMMSFREIRATFRFDWDVWKAILVKSWPIAISIIFNVVYLKGDILLLSLFRDQVDVGVYGAAYRVVDILAQMAMMIMGVILPLLAYHWSRNKKDSFAKQYQQAFDIMMMLAMPMMVGLILTADKIMLLVAGSDFVVSGRPLQILAIAVFGVYLGAVFGHTAVAIDKQKQTMWIYISNAIITLIGYLVFIPRFGYWGAAWMTVFSEVYAGVLLFFTIRHFTKQSLSFVTTRKIVASAVVMAGVIWLLASLSILIIMPIAAVVYGLCIFLSGAISKETLIDILSMKKRA